MLTSCYDIIISIIVDNLHLCNVCNIYWSLNIKKKKKKNVKKNYNIQL